MCAERLGRRPVLSLREPDVVGGHSMRASDSRPGYDSFSAAGLRNPGHALLHPLGQFTGGCRLSAQVLGMRGLKARGPEGPRVAVDGDRLLRPSQYFVSSSGSRALAQKPCHSAHHKRLILNCRFAQIPPPGIRCLWATNRVIQRKHGNPERTYANKVGHVAIFLKSLGNPCTRLHHSALSRVTKIYECSIEIGRAHV